MIEKYKKITFKSLLSIPFLMSLFCIDSFILPQNASNDVIIAYSKIFVSSGNKISKGKTFVGYKYYTQKGHEFSTQEIFIEENEVSINRSYIFKNITGVKSVSKNYSEQIISGFNGACLYFSVGLLLSAICSLLLLKYDNNLSENAFLNIILFNSFLAICSLYIFILHN